MRVPGPSLDLERELWMAGCLCVAGLDEAGRGAWAGPVVAAAVVLPPNRGDVQSLLQGVDDSKRLTPKQREALFPLIYATALAVGVGRASARFIDTAGIVPATHRAMSIALRNLGVSPDWLLIDALELPRVQQPQRGVIHGDALVLSIAAASIVAKVSRDRLMVALDARLPGYGFAVHKGYGTRAHRAALERLGPCQAHRLSFAPLRSLSGCPAQQSPSGHLGMNHPGELVGIA
jgi:ribonuclease HII